MRRESRTKWLVYVTTPLKEAQVEGEVGEDTLSEMHERAREWMKWGRVSVPTSVGVSDDEGPSPLPECFYEQMLDVSLMATK